MNYQNARKEQYRRNSYYTVFLVSPTGERELLGHTQRKSGTGLLNLLYRPSVQERIKKLPDAENAGLQKYKDRLELSNGYKIVFGGTMIQESE